MRILDASFAKRLRPFAYADFPKCMRTTVLALPLTTLLSKAYGELLLRN